MLNRNLNLEALAIQFASNDIFISGARVKLLRKKYGVFSVCAPSTLCPPVTEHVPLHSKSLCKSLCKLYAPTKLGGGGGGGGGRKQKISELCFYSAVV